MRFLLVDRIESVTPGTSITGWKCVAMSEDYLEWHFPGQPIVPGTLVLEAFAQLAGWHEAVTSEFSRWVLVDRIASARYFGTSGPGDRIDLSLEVVANADPARRSFRGESKVGGERRALVEIEGKVVSLEDLDAKARVEKTYHALLGEAPGRKGTRGRS